MLFVALFMISPATSIPVNSKGLFTALFSAIAVQQSNSYRPLQPPVTHFSRVNLVATPDASLWLRDGEKSGNLQAWELDLAENLMKGITFAAEKHKNQKRKDSLGTPYINHPIAVVGILVNAGVYDLDILNTAMLHDCIEDTGTTYKEVELE